MFNNHLILSSLDGLFATYDFGQRVNEKKEKAYYTLKI